jgi:hypothetical protein
MLLLDAILTYLGISGNYAKELNPIFQPIAGTWQGIVISLLITILAARIINLEITHRKIQKHSKIVYNIVLAISSLVVFSNSLIIILGSTHFFFK